VSPPTPAPAPDLRGMGTPGPGVTAMWGAPASVGEANTAASRRRGGDTTDANGSAGWAPVDSTLCAAAVAPPVPGAAAPGAKGSAKPPAPNARVMSPGPAPAPAPTPTTSLPDARRFSVRATARVSCCSTPAAVWWPCPRRGRWGSASWWAPSNRRARAGLPSGPRRGACRTAGPVTLARGGSTTTEKPAGGSQSTASPGTSPSVAKPPLSSARRPNSKSRVASSGRGTARARPL
jgi:hypothetical protein